MIISHQHRFIFFRNGKTGTSSIGTALGHLNEIPEANSSLDGLWSVKHMPPAVARAMLPPEIWRGYFKFVFVRHPVDWFVSSFRYNFSPDLKTKADRITGFRSLGVAMRKRQERRSLNAVEEFDVEHVDRLAAELSRYRGAIMTPTLFQSTYVFDQEGAPLTDFVGRFESLDADIEFCLQRIGIDVDIPHANKSKNRSGAERISPRGLERIHEIWRRDFELLGYDVPSGPVLSAPAT